MKNWTNDELEYLKKLKQSGESHADIAAILGRSKTAINRKADSLLPEEKKGKVVIAHPEIKLPKPEFGYLPISLTDSGEWIRYGLVSDTHLACREEQLSALHNQYDLFKKEGIATVLHCGNIIDGYVPKINGASVYETSIDGQVQYCIDNYPQRKGITTYYLTANDHDFAWQGAKEGFNGGFYMTAVAKAQGREDLIYVGHIECDVAVQGSKKKDTIIRMSHGGGGMPYAASYIGQRTVDSYTGGEKPEILLIGHHHCGCYQIVRNIHVINLPGFQEQTIFGRTKKLRYEVGGALLSFKINPEDGSVTRCQVEFNMYYNRTYYRRYLRSDTKLLKGKIVLPK